MYLLSPPHTLGHLQTLPSASKPAKNPLKVQNVTVHRAIATSQRLKWYQEPGKNWSKRKGQAVSDIIFGSIEYLVSFNSVLEIYINIHLERVVHTVYTYYLQK